MDNTCRKGVKRKHEEEGDENHAWQRKSIIDMSMGKLRTNPSPNSRRLEPCLRRSVLILNTLKHIESELAQEGVDYHQSTEAAMNEIPEMSVTQLTLDPLPLPDMSSFICPLPASPIPMSVDASHGVENENNDYLSLVDSAVVDLLPCKPLVGCQDQALSQTSSSVYYASGPSQDLASSSPSSLFYSSTALDSRAMSPLPVYAYDGPALDMLPAMPLFTPNSLLPNPVLELPKVSVSEAGDSNNNNSAAQGPYSVCSSSSFGDDCLSEAEVIEFLHSLQEASDTMTPPNSPPPSSSASVLNAQCSAYCRSDSALDELDSIMQILVGI